MTELYILIAFTLGAALVTYLNRAEINRLTRVNSELLGSLFHRIGYKPTGITSKAPGEIAPNLSDDTPSPYPHDKYSKNGFPDLFQRKADVLAASDKKHQEENADRPTGLPENMTYAQFNALPMDEKFKLFPID